LGIEWNVSTQINKRPTWRNGAPATDAAISLLILPESRLLYYYVTATTTSYLAETEQKVVKMVPGTKWCLAQN